MKYSVCRKETEMKDYVVLGTAIEGVSRPDEKKTQSRLEEYRKALQEAAKREESENDA